MPIDLVKKSKKDSAISLNRRQVADNGNKKSLEERLEKRFSHLPDLAYRQKVKIMWSVAIFFSVMIMIFWFYLVSQGALFYAPSTQKEGKNNFIKFSELTSGFKQLKNISINQLLGEKKIILNLKNQLELSAAKSEIINKLKDNLENGDGLAEFNMHEESRVKIQYPNNLPVSISQNGDEANQTNESSENIIEPDLESWKEYQDIDDGFSFKYPDELNISEDLGQFIFRDKNPDGFSFYFFAIEPEIDNLEKWIQESSVSSDEEIISYGDHIFGDVAVGIYYEAKAKKDDELELEKEDFIGMQRSFGYIFNHGGITYLLRTNKENFQNAFNNVLNSIKLNSSSKMPNF